MKDIVQQYIDNAYRRVEDITPLLQALPTVQLALDLTPAQKYIALHYGQAKQSTEVPALGGGQPSDLDIS